MASVPPINVKIQTVNNLKKYIEFRTAQLDYEESQIGQPGAINMGTHLAKRQAIEMARWVLRELETLVMWQQDGEPGFAAPLTQVEKEVWAKAKARGIDIPAEIEAQL